MVGFADNLSKSERWLSGRQIRRERIWTHEVRPQGEAHDAPSQSAMER